MSLTKVSYSMIAGEAINVLDYGAVGDGVTDDMQAIMDAINAAVPGQAVYFPAGVYFVDPPTDDGMIFTNLSKIVFFGSMATIKQAFSNRKAIFTFNGCNNLTFDGLIFDLNGRELFGGCLKFYGGSEFRIQNCTFTDSDPSPSTSDRFHLVVADDVTYGNCGDVYITNNLIEGGQLDFICRRVFITNNFFSGTVNRGIGIATNGNNRNLSQYLIENNVFSQTNDSFIGIGVDPSANTGATIENITIRGNSFLASVGSAGASAAITMTSVGLTNYMRNIVIADNVMHDYIGQKFVAIDSGGNRAKGIVITGNTYMAQTATSNPVISLLGIESSVISNNAMHGTITNGINVTQMVGCSFTGNMIEASNAGIVFDSGLTGRNILSANKTSSAATYEVQVVDQQSTDQLNLATDQIPTISIVNNQPNIRYADKFAYFSTASPQSVDYVYGAYKGQVLTIEFADANCTMKDGTGNMKLASDFAASADDTLTMVFNGTNWYEIARSVN